MFWGLLQNIHLNSCTIFNDFESEKVFNIKNMTSKQTNKPTQKNETNSELKTDAAVPHYYCHNFLCSVLIWNMT